MHANSKKLLCNRSVSAYNPTAGETVITEWLDDDHFDIYQRRGCTRSCPTGSAFTAAERDRICMRRPASDTATAMCWSPAATARSNYVVGMHETPRNLDLPVAVLPTGTANDFAGHAGRAGRTFRARAARSSAARSRRVDLVSRADDEYFVNVFSCGLFTDVSQKTPDRC